MSTELRLFEIELAEGRRLPRTYDLKTFDTLKEDYSTLRASRWNNPVMVVAHEDEFNEEDYPEFDVKERVVLIPTGGFSGYGAQYADFVEANQKRLLGVGMESNFARMVSDLNIHIKDGVSLASNDAHTPEELAREVIKHLKIVYDLKGDDWT